MVRVKVFCMQKEEEDILEDWILYHAHLFGMDNLYIVDNYSNDSSVSILRKYEPLGLHWEQLPDYPKKGDYLFSLIKQHQDDCDFAIPLDIDEFVGIMDINKLEPDLIQGCVLFDQSYYISMYPQVLGEAKTPKTILDHFIKKGYNMGWSSCRDKKETNPQENNQFILNNKDILLKSHPKMCVSCEKSLILDYLEHLEPYGRYSFLYYLTSRNYEINYDNPMVDITAFNIVDYEYMDGKHNYNKKLFKPKELIGLDHGNHFGKVKGLTQDQYKNTQLVLFHYHHRGVRKLIEKCKNDIKGLHIVKDLNNKNELREKIKEKVNGSHNIITYLTLLEKGPDSLIDSTEGEIVITTLSEKIGQLRGGNQV